MHHTPSLSKGKQRLLPDALRCKRRRDKVDVYGNEGYVIHSVDALRSVVRAIMMMMMMTLLLMLLLLLLMLLLPHPYLESCIFQAAADFNTAFSATSATRETTSPPSIIHTHTHITTQNVRPPCNPSSPASTLSPGISGPSLPTTAATSRSPCMSHTPSLATTSVWMPELRPC